MFRNEESSFSACLLGCYERDTRVTVGGIYFAKHFVDYWTIPTCNEDCPSPTRQETTPAFFGGLLEDLSVDQRDVKEEDRSEKEPVKVTERVRNQGVIESNSRATVTNSSD